MFKDTALIASLGAAMLDVALADKDRSENIRKLARLIDDRATICEVDW